ncbi:uncharacterized protein TNCT_216171 [Trichonephila clavata]|uniref:Uncharacterized protein n=1 Tax=Trichonephila clavata TaxID=2740835 RepID=A0A8X6FHL8_TRICU|nr:uncharacterized protein TNCT_216171 [Trichonephila clavata]
MDTGLGVRWPLSPFATAIAAGALVAFCVAFWKKRYFPRRRDSAPASTSQETQNINNSKTSSGLSKSNSDPSLNVFKIDNKPTFSAISSIPSISNFASSDGKLISSKIRLPEISKLELRPLHFNDDNIRNLPKFTKLYNLPISQKTSYSKVGTIFGLNLHELILRENVNLFGSIYSHIRPFSKNFCPFIGHYQALKLDTSCQILNPVYVPSSALTKPYSGRTFEGPITKSFKSVVREEDFYSFYRKKCDFDLEKRKKVNSNSKNKIENSFERKDVEQISEQPAEKGNAIPNTNFNGVETPFNRNDLGVRKRKNVSPCSENQTVQNINLCETTKHFEESDVDYPVLKYERKEDISSITSSNSRDFSFNDNNYLESRTKYQSPIENETIEEYHPFEMETFECILENTSSLAPSKENVNLGKSSNDKNISSDKNNLRDSLSFETDSIKESIETECVSEHSNILEEFNSIKSSKINEFSFQESDIGFKKGKIVQTCPESEINACKFEHSSRNFVKAENISMNKYSVSEVLPFSENSEKQLVSEHNKKVPSALGNCHKLKITDQECAVTRDTLHEVKKSINSTQASNQKPKLTKENLEIVQEDGDKGGGVMTTRKNELSFALETKQTIWIGERNSAERPIHGTLVGGEEGKEQQIRSGAFRVTNDRDVTGVVEVERGDIHTRTPDERKARSFASQMDRGSGKQTVENGAAAGWNAGARVFESSVTSETRIRPGGVSTVVSSVTVDDNDHLWSSSEVDTKLDNMSLKTIITTDHTFVDRDEGIYRPTFEEFIPVQSPHGDTLDDTIKELNEIAGRPLVLEESPPRVSRLIGLLSRDEERRARAQRLVEQEGASIDGEWDRILRNVLASVSELERWEEDGKADEEQRRRRDVSSREDAEDDRQHPRQSRSSLTMEEEVSVPTPKGETPTKVKNLRFKLDPDIFDVPSDDSFYEDDEKDGRWKRQPKYRAFSSLELNDEPIKLVSVHASVVPAGQKMVARPVGIDLRVRLTEERQSKRAHVGSSPSQAKRRSPVSENRIGWCQELSPVTENVDWRETFTTVSKENNINNNNVSESKPVPNGILKSPSPKVETVSKDSSNPFRDEEKLTNGVTNGVTEKPKPKPVPNGVPLLWNAPPKKLSLPRKKFEPDPEAIERITGYKTALTKPPLPPPVFHKTTSPIVRNRAEMARKQYLDSKAVLAQPKNDGSKKFQQFLAQAQNDRARIVTSVPDLGAIEKAVSEKWAKEKGSASLRESPAREEVLKVGDTTSSRGSTPDDAWASYVQSCRKHLGRRSQSLSYLETEIDIPVVEDDDKWRSTSALDEPDSEDHPLPVEDSDFEQSREDLDDSGRAKSEHELRIQKSLQSLPLPDWYKRSDKTKSGFILKSAEKEKRGWAAAKSLASSTSSLASCGLKRPIHSLRSSRENIPWSRGSSSPDGPALSLALARAFREPYLGWRARTSTSSGVSSSPRTSPPSWCNATTDEEANGVSFDGEDAFGQTSSEDGRHEEPPSLDDTGADAVTVSMDTGDLIKLPGGEDTCDDINNMSMDTCELFDASLVPDVVDEPSPQADTGDDIDNLSTDTTDDKKKDPKLKRYSYSQSIYYRLLRRLWCCPTKRQSWRDRLQGSKKPGWEYPEPATPSSHDLLDANTIVCNGPALP